MSPITTILHVIDTTGPGGAETVFINLADGLRDKGFRSIALIRGKGWVYEELQRRNIETVILDCKGSFNIRFLLKLCALIKKERVDIIQSHLLGSNIYCAMAGLLARKPVFATFHGAVDVSKTERFLKLKAWILNKGVTKFIAVSKGLLEEIRQSGLLNADKAVVIYNGIDTSKYYKRDSEAIRSSLGLDKYAILVGSLGNIRPAKAYDVLIKAAAIVIKENPHFHFVIAGDTNKEPLMSELKQLMNQLKVINNVHFIGFQDNSAEFLGQMDIFLLTSSSEGFSIATIEALATGLPVVATKCGGPEEILADVDDSLLTNSAPLTIANKLLDLMTKLNTRNTDSFKKYDLKTVIQSHAQHYGKHLEQSAS
ncbi:hypothetical protein A3758_09390 [Oleiphilus sp. HI0118]|nr:hypothetical protein A3758_09390 [Oleiphilus sp. HI0118]KZZ77274.1 hypothetical protein A3767_19960 [Oleiphilus sp. HI0133]KZZ80509.1 hypothetical protein A3767_09760 [Oleiphilus sp. HI0133]